MPISSLGICLGATTITAVELIDSNGGPVRGRSYVRPHEGDPHRAVKKLLAEMPPEEYKSIAVTGGKLRERLNLTSITEVEATESALDWITGDGPNPYAAVASIGAETFIVYEFSSGGTLTYVHSESKCASGTGEFFLQMMRRMDLDVAAGLELAAGAEPHKVSGRCSVFCKSDCTHALNVGHSVGSVVAGLCEMMAEKIAYLIRRPLANVRRGDGRVSGGREDEAGSDGYPKILIVGGLTRNHLLVDFLKRMVPEVVVREESAGFEALGAAVWAARNPTTPFPRRERLFKTERSQYGRLAPLTNSLELVTFAENQRGEPDPDCEYILGVDVGSTTTKAVLVRLPDHAVVAGEYLRTHGDPVGASRRCYRSLLDQVDDGLKIVGLGVTGSGRQITGLHALTEGVINEIIAHATAAAYFDPEVDTIFEIGGQDAKYTYLVNGVPCDYAMNEACSAGTGSFLEESARETLGIDVEEIAEVALSARLPANFSDQCAAFISSDLKNAMHEGFSIPDMVAGLVYSICMNYGNKVRGSRPVGNKVFMQGGVCYNRAVPAAMAALIGKPIIVPPEPGLAGALGVALEVEKRIGLGLMKRDEFRLSELAGRAVEYARSFTCPGGGEKCDLGCEIRTTVVDGRKIPFGGSCDRYYNLRLGRKVKTGELDLVRLRNRMVFEDFAFNFDSADSWPTVGMNRSFMIHNLYPFFSNFFGEMGMRLVLPEKVDPQGVERKSTSYCFPAELAHGFYEDLLKKNPDHIVLPHIIEFEVPGRNPDVHEQQNLCVVCQAEPYFLRPAFKDVPTAAKVHMPVFNFWHGIEGDRKTIIRLARQLGIRRKTAERAFDVAVGRQRACDQAMWKKGAGLIEEISRDRNRKAVVLFGRAYNAYASEANMGIPHKFASRGIMVIPCEFLPISDVQSESWMHWASGHLLLRASRKVAANRQLFGTWISNFSCGPDSFLIGWFRSAMGTKPSLTLEIDNHTADAGINTRIDAFLDIVEKYRLMEETGVTTAEPKRFTPAGIQLFKDDSGAPPRVILGSGKRLDLKDPSVHVLVPPMGDLASQVFSAVFRGLGIRSTEAPDSTGKTLQLGRSCTACKECLPLTLCAGALLDHLDQRPPDEVTIYFMPTAQGNCRFGQYSHFFEELIEKRRIENCALLTLSSQDNYAGMGLEFARREIYGTIISDAMRDIRNAIRALAVDPKQGIEVFNREWGRILHSLENDAEEEIEKAVSRTAGELAGIPLKRSISEANTVLLAGEIYLRVDEFSCNLIGERLASSGIVMKTAPVFEWLRYVEWLVNRGIIGDSGTKSPGERLGALLVDRWERSRERRLKRALAESGLYEPEFVEISTLVRAGSGYVSPRLTGETILVTGAALHEILDSVCGVISIGPFACLPSRLCEALLTSDFTLAKKRSYRKTRGNSYPEIDSLPFLAIEADGRPYPPLIEARLEAFILQAKRLGERMRSGVKASAER